MKMYFLLLLLIKIAHSDIVLSPSKNSTRNIGIILAPGAFISETQYEPLAKRIQNLMEKRDVGCYIYIPHFIGDISFSYIFERKIESSLESLRKFDLSEVYLSGHSLGGQNSFEYMIKKPENFDGLILLGSFISRSQRGKSLPKKTLVIGGELDGLSRITRFAEEFYHRNYFLGDFKNYVNSNRNNFTSIVVIEGLNHMGFASGEPTWLVNKRDLKSENTEEDNHNFIAANIASFVLEDTEELKSSFEATKDLLTPLIKAYELEGSIHFNRPDQSTCVRGYCSIGSPFGILTQEYVLGKDDILKDKNVSLNITNDYVILSSLPPFGDLHHPKMSVQVDNGQVSVNISTYSQCGWDTLDKYVDAAFQPTSANEIGIKMISRQCSLIKILNKTKSEAPLTVDANYCRKSNELSYNIALDLAGKRTRERFEKYGQKVYSMMIK